MNPHVRRALLELATFGLEELASATAEALSDRAEPAARRGPPDGRVFTNERELPQAEVGDEMSALERERAIRAGAIPPRDGIVEQDGKTEAEYAALR